MKWFCMIFVVSLVMIFSCSEPLDASKIEIQKMVLDSASTEPVEVNVPKGAFEFPGAEPEDMLGLYSIYSKKVRADNFAIEVEFTTLSDVDKEQILEEKLEKLKFDSDSFRLIKKTKDGFFYETKEINGDFSYGFVKLIVTDSKYAVIFPEPTPEGNISLEEASFMYDILNRN